MEMIRELMRGLVDWIGAMVYPGIFILMAMESFPCFPSPANW